MAYTYWTQCVKAAKYSGPINLPGAGILAAILGGISLNAGVAAVTAILGGIAFCRWWLYGRLVCLGGDKCAIGLALEVFPPEDKTGLDKEDTDYSVNLLLAPSTLYESFNQACQDPQGKLMKMSSDPDFQTMMSNYSNIGSTGMGLGFTGEPEPFSALVNPEGQMSGVGYWQPNYVYQPGATIQISSSDYRTFVQTCNATGPSGPNQPAWGTTIGDITTDGVISWTCTSQYSLLTQAVLLSMGLVNPGSWSSGSQYNVGDLILVGNSGGNNSQTQSVQVCIASGTSANTAPNWPMTFGVVTDESQTTSSPTSNVQWSCLGIGGRWSPTYLDSDAYAQHSTKYQVLDCIIDHNGNLQQCQTPGYSGPTIPNWATAHNATTNDGQVVWKRVAASSYPAWQMTTAYLTGDVIEDSNNNLQLCTAAGTTSSAPPIWATTPGHKTPDGQVLWKLISTPAWPSWEAKTSYLAGTQIVDSNGAAQTCVASGQSGSTPPVWGTGDGTPTADTNPSTPAAWVNVGEATNSIGTIEVEFEGGGMYDFYVGLLWALPLAILAAAVGVVTAAAIFGTALPAAAAAAASGPWGWLLALLILLVAVIAQAVASALASAPAAAAAGTGFLQGQTDFASPAADDPNIGTIYPGIDVLVVMGRWIYDSAHSGWNELHPVLHCQKIAKTGVGDLMAGDPWVNLPQFNAANVETTLNQHTSERMGWCPLIHEAGSKETLKNQQAPQNKWRIHPLLDGCTPTEPVRLA